MPPWAWLVLQAVSCTLVAVLTWLWVSRARTNAPGPPAIPVIGNLHNLGRIPLLSRFGELHRQYGNIFRLFLGPKLLVVVAHPEDAKELLLTARIQERDPYTARVKRPFVGDGLLTLKGNQWRAHRKMINPVFNPGLLESSLPTLHEIGLSLSDQLGQSNGAPTDVYPMIILAAVRATCSTVIGVKPNSLFPDITRDGEIGTNIINALDTMQKILFRPWMHLECLLPLFPSGRAGLKFCQGLRQKTAQCIMSRAATPAGDTQPKRWRTMLETLVKPGGEMLLPLEEARDELVTVLLAAMETSASSMSNVMALLALHPDWQDAAQQELREVFGDGADYLRAPTTADLARLRVLESIIKETLRLFPPVPNIARQAAEDLILAGGRVLVPKGALIFLSTYVIHRLPEFYSDPELFNPGRFLDSDAGKRHQCSYIPFGLGPRNCVGAQYARIQLKVFLAAVLRRHRLLPHSSREDMERIKVSVTARPLEPVMVSCEPLEWPPRTRA